MDPTAPSTMLGRYRIVRPLSRGAMGQVYEAVDPRLGRTVAIKTILKGHLLDDTLADEYSARFVREAQAAARLNHPNIVAVFDFGQEGEVAYLVMEFVRGRELAQLLEGGAPLAPAEAVRIVGELLDALDYAHAQGIVHRDVKPANVMLDAAGRVKLADFGVARIADAGSDRTAPGTLVGTPSYMAPEQVLGQAVGSRADIFAAGVVLYQCLTGERPFGSGGAFTVQKRIVHDDAAPPSRVNAALAPRFDAVLARALAKAPEDRFESAARFAEALRAAGAAPAEPAVARVAAPVPPPPPPVPPPDIETVRQDDDATVVLAPAAPAAAPAPRRRIAIAAGGAAVLALAAWAGAGWLARSVPEPKSATTAPPPAPETAPPPPVTAVAPPPAAAPGSAPGALPRPADPPKSIRPAPTVAAKTVAPSRRRGDARCAELLQRVQLGEQLPAESQDFLARECRP